MPSSPDDPSVPAEPAPAPASGEPSRASPLLDRAAALFPRIDRILFPIFAGAAVLYVALLFYGSLHRQTGGAWSAPLDDVFIHFDYARATARGYPFQWSEGNGFSSGNTSLSYPFVLAFGYWVGFRGMAIMQWAAIVACLSTLAFFLSSARLARGLGRWGKYLFPPIVLSLGALDWSLFSGMENSFHLAMWGLALGPCLALARLADPSILGDDPPFERLPADELARRVRRLGMLGGVASALLFATRPESVVCIASFAIFAALPVRRALGNKAALATLVRIGLPGALTLVLQAVANRVFTGEWSANGAIAKLAINNPYMTVEEKVDQYFFLLKYVILRNTQHHFSDVLPFGWLVPIVAALPLIPKRTRAVATLLWVNVAGWLLLVSLNGQVRWQNERYTMSAVAWLLLLAALGVGVILSHRLLPARDEAPPSGRIAAPLRIAIAVTIGSIYWHFQLPNMKDQIWFFGRASRNILDQHVQAGKILAELGPKRVLIGDAGALMYASDRRGLDIIGLGGYHDYPFARAGVHGLGASLELIERMPSADRPDLMAIYPSWWGDLPTLFGHRITGVRVVGNVICGDAEKVIYRADWHTLEGHSEPRDLREGEAVVDELDVADLISEKDHRYVHPHPSMGFVDFRVLADPADPSRDLFEAGRVIPNGQKETARVRGPRGAGRIVVRTVVGHKASIEVSEGGRVLGHIALRPTKGWSEASLDLPPGLPRTMELGLVPVEGEWLDGHVWIVEGTEGRSR
ncbi:MAG: hypothetical protein U0359_01050 [Byssovorax sp.]